METEAQVRLEVLRELVKTGETDPDSLVTQTLRLSHVVEHGHEPTDAGQSTSK